MNCEIDLDLSWTKDCLLIDHHNDIKYANFKISITKLYIHVITLSINNNINFLENLWRGFKRTISWNKYMS